MEKGGEGIRYLFKKSLTLALHHQNKIGITHTSDGIRITEKNKCDPVIQKEIYEDWKKNSGQYDPKNDVIPEWEMDALHPRTVNDIKFEQYLLREYGMTRKEEIEKTFGGNIDALLKMSTIFDVFTLGATAVAKLTGKKVWKEVGEEVGEKAVKAVVGETSEILEKELVEGTMDDVAKIVTKVEDIGENDKTLLSGEGWYRYFQDTYGVNNVSWNISSFDDMLVHPASLPVYTADEIGQILGDGWTRAVYGSNGSGWKFIQDTHPDNMVFYHGGGVHEGAYWGVKTGRIGTVKVVDTNTYIPLPGDKAIIIYTKDW